MGGAKGVDKSGKLTGGVDHLVGLKGAVFIPPTGMSPLNPSPYQM